MSDRAQDAAAIAALRVAAPGLCATVAERLNQDPYWQARVGADGHPLAAAVGQAHLLALLDALEANEPARFVAYVRTHQLSLVDQGLSSRHLAHHLELLSEAMSEGPLGERAGKLFRQGIFALEREPPGVLALEKVATAAAKLALETLDESLPGWHQGWTAEPGPTPRELSRQWTAFVVDAVVLARGDALAGYFRWLAAHLAQNGQGARLAQDIKGALRYGFSAQQGAGAAAVEALDATETGESSATPPRAQ